MQAIKPPKKEEQSVLNRKKKKTNSARQMSAPEEEVVQDPILAVARIRFLLTTSNQLSSSAASRRSLQDNAVSLIKAHLMAPAYIWFCNGIGECPDEALLESLRQQNDKDVAGFESKAKDAEENLGESEVRDALLEKAQYLHRIGNKDATQAAYDTVLQLKAMSIGQKFDIAFALMRLGFAFEDHRLIQTNLQAGHALVKQGGDWERRNRLKVYEGLFELSCRHFSRAATLLLECIATFSSYEIMQYRNFAAYAVLAGLVAVDRVTLREKVVDSPEILAVVNEIGPLKGLLNSLYDCSYGQFMSYLLQVADLMKTDPFIARHATFYHREMRLRGYLQYLESYKSVTMQNLSETFRISAESLDRDLSRFIASGRLNARIDKVQGIIETSRPDSKNSLYQSTIKQGDALLNRVQRLSRVVDI